MERTQALLELQELDLEAMREQKRLDEMPEKLAILETRKKSREVTALRGKAEQLVSQLAQAVSKHEDECAMLDAKIAEEQAKLMGGEVTNPKEVVHITREMDALKRRKDKLEMEEIALMERVEKANGQVAKVDAALAQLATKEGALTEQYKSKGADMLAEIETLKARRTELTAALGADLLKTYESLRESKGVAAGRLDGAMCTACRMELPGEAVASLLAGPEISTCPRCHRLIVVLPGAGE